MLMQLFVGLRGGLCEVENDFYFARLLFIQTNSPAELTMQLYAQLPRHSSVGSAGKGEVVL